MIDTHCHIIPYVDDGAKNIEDTLAMGRIASEDGITDIVATPHYIVGTSTVATAARVEEEILRLNELFIENEIDLKVYPGCEVFITPELPELLKSGRVCAMNHSRYVLVELPMSTIPLYTEEVFYELELMQYIPILAHPERNVELCNRPNIIARYFDRGILMQVNAGSLMGEFGKKTARLSWNMVQDGLVHFVASDAHRQRTRTPRLNEVRKALAKKAGPENADLLTAGNPARLLNNEEIKNLEPYCRRNAFSTFTKKLFNIKI